MSSSGQKQVAWLFIFLLAGHEVVEARRVRKAALVDMKRSYGASSSTAEKVASVASSIVPGEQGLPQTNALADKMWQAENAKCGSMGMFCDAQKHEGVAKCASQPLKGDIRPSVKCRLTDEWMLKGSAEQPATWWVRFQVKLMKAKAAKYQAECHEDKKKGSRVCLRRMQHIVRAVKFISKASSKGVLATMSPEEQTEIQKESQEAQNKLGQSMMSAEQMLMFKRLVEATNKDQHGLQTAPIATIKKTLKVLEYIVLSDPVEALEMLKELEEETHPADPENVAEMADEIQKDSSSIVESFDNAVSDLDGTLNNEISDLEDNVNLTDANATEFQSSLVQLRDGETVVKWVGFITIAALLVLSLMYLGGIIVTILLVWVASSVFGCTAYSLGRYAMAKELGKKTDGPTKMAGTAGNCVAMFVSAPFRYIFKGVKAVASLIPRKGAASGGEAKK